MLGDFCFGEMESNGFRIRVNQSYDGLYFLEVLNPVKNRILLYTDLGFKDFKESFFKHCLENNPKGLIESLLGSVVKGYFKKSWFSKKEEFSKELLEKYKNNLRDLL